MLKKKTLLTLIKIVKKTLRRTILSDVKTIAVKEREMKLNSKHNKNK